jgi:hypothetical protein
MFIIVYKQQQQNKNEEGRVDGSLCGQGTGDFWPTEPT